MADGWNAFQHAKTEEVEIKEGLNDPIIGKIHSCGHYFSQHDELGCVRRNCECETPFSELKASVKNDDSLGR